MKIERIKSFEEDEDVQTQKYYACKINSENPSSFIKKISKKYKICNFLKRVGYENTILLQPVSLGQPVDFKDFFIVKVPLKAPITYEQKIKSNKIWPCHYYPYKEEKISLDNEILRNINLVLKNKNFESCCSACCLIFDPKSKEVLTIQNDEKDILGHAVLKCIEYVSRSKKGYLCTEMEAYLYREPCISCAMAFVHARIKRVFFIEEGLDKNKPYTELKLNYNTKLNHRYKVYKISDLNINV